MFKTRTVKKEVKIGDLFDNVGVSEEPYDENPTDYEIRVKSPYGYKSIEDFFRTEEQEAVTLYFKNNKTLECSLDHKLKVNGEWKKVKNIEKGDVIETETGVTSIKKVKNKGSKKLYDISVEDVHCYYSNSVLSHNSWTLSHIGLSAVQKGYNVAHYTLELDQNQTGLRYDSLLSGVPPNEVREHQEEIQKAVEELEGDLTVKYYPTKSASVQTLQAHFDKQQAIRGRPDMILIDYADLLAARAGERSDNTYLQMGNIYNQLRKLAGELQVPIWTVSQATRNAIDEDVIEADMIADSYKKIMISDFILSLSRKKSDKLSNTARLHVMKNRVGRDGMVYPCIMNVDNGKIEVYDPESKKGIEIKNEMDKSEGEAEMDLLKGKYRNHKRKKNGQSENGHMSSDDLINDLVGDDEEDEDKKSTGITV